MNQRKCSILSIEHGVATVLVLVLVPVLVLVLVLVVCCALAAS